MSSREPETITVEIAVRDAKCLCYGPLTAALAGRTEEIGRVLPVKVAVAAALHKAGVRLRTDREISDAFRDAATHPASSEDKQ